MANPNAITIADVIFTPAFSLAGDFSTTGAFNTVFAQQASGTMTLPAGSATLLGDLAVTSAATPQFARLGIGAAANGTIPFLVFRGAIGATPSSGFILTNTTAAAAGAQQYSPAIQLHGSGWKTDATAGAQDVDWRVYSVPVQGAAAPTANVLFDYSVNGGAYANKMTLTSASKLSFAAGGIVDIPFYAGGITFGGTTPFSSGAGIIAVNATAIRIVSSTGEAAVTGTRLQVGTAGMIGWSSTGDASSGQDLDMRKTVAGVPNISDGITARAGWNFQWHGQSRVATQYDQTTTTLGNVTGLTSTLKAGRTYKFLAHLDATLDATGGGKYAMGGTCTATAISYRVRHLGASLAIVSSARQTALASAVNATATLTDDDVVIEGMITVNAAGTLTAQFAQQGAGGTSSILVGSDMMIWDVQ